ncbi:hypothetical protein [Siphonobacter sp. SORGH_AS_0500]|uniref:hypothetical protein n=1 Tax=Siphonobacter sp. SORGH_AS_0500 TaxID=1864824 RepID=UPI0028571ECF|nr:hypothetical protein [Siphonobacter sp. SORGH_AS_0500]MDR6193157.1 hypothetical protein [Siphonobacter sp. SORGH_AS_0500]
MSVVPPLPLKPARRRRTRLWSKDPKRSAKVAGLIYTTDDQPGILRLRHSKSFRYVDADKKPIRDVENPTPNPLAGDPPSLGKSVDKSVGKWTLAGDRL